MCPFNYNLINMIFGIVWYLECINPIMKSKLWCIFMFERYQVFQVIVLLLTERITLLDQDMSTLKTIVKEVSCQSFRDL